MYRPQQQQKKNCKNDNTNKTNEQQRVRESREEQRNLAQSRESREEQRNLAQSIRLLEKDGVELRPLKQCCDLLVACEDTLPVQGLTQGLV
jgi:hypothetical protein